MNDLIIYNFIKINAEFKQVAKDRGFWPYLAEKYNELQTYLDSAFLNYMDVELISKITSRIWELAVANLLLKHTTANNAQKKVYLYNKKDFDKKLAEFKKCHEIDNITQPDFLISVNDIDFVFEATQYSRTIVDICLDIYNDGLENEKCLNKLRSIKLPPNATLNSINAMLMTAEFSKKDIQVKFTYSLLDWIKTIIHLNRIKCKLPDEKIQRIETLDDDYQQITELGYTQYLSNSLFSIGQHHMPIIEAWISDSLRAKLCKGCDLLLMSEFDEKLCVDITGNAAILTNDNKIYFVISDKVSKKDTEVQCVNIEERCGIEKSSSKDPIKANADENIIKQVIREATSKAGYTLCVKNKKANDKLNNFTKYLYDNNTGYILTLSTNIVDDITNKHIYYVIEKLLRCYFDDPSYSWISGVLISERWATWFETYHEEYGIVTDVQNDFVLYHNRNAVVKFPKDTLLVQREIEI